ncbi:hypothetical protein P8452_57208 [Trifolium repens]|nr:hypothetical protein P8452_57208 [Trifolium repens]
MNKGKNHKKSLLTCFKAVVAVDDDDDNVKPQRRRKRNGTTDPVLAYLAAADEDGVVLFSTAAKEECGSRRRKRGRDTWHALRMAFNDTSLMKKILSKRKAKKDSMSRSNSNTESETINKLKPTRRTTSNTSSNIANSPTLFSSTSSLNSTTSSYHDHMSNTSSHEVNNIPKPPPLKGTNCSVSKKSSFVEDKSKRNIALCMLWIISLLVLILWGKFFAILCTSIWFYFVPFRQRRKCKGVIGSYRESEFDSVQYKKKIIMEGILERSHSRASLMTSASSTSMTKS